VFVVVAALMGRALFVYYRIGHQDEVAVLDALRSLHVELRKTIPGLRCERWRREAPGSDGLLTLMESYTTTDGSIDANQQALIESRAAAALGRWIIGVRHTEVFLRCA
jgi:Domain of unknown function (DUF4936)